MQMQIDLRAEVAAALEQYLSLQQRLADRISYSEREAAQQIGVPVSVLRLARADGELSCCRLGRRIVYTRQELLRWLSAKEERPR